jgi:hypothetical protein
MMINYRPWQHLILDDFLSQDRFEEIKKLAETELEYLDMFGFYTRSNHYLRYVKEDIIPEVNSLFLEFKESRPYSKSLKKIIHWSIHPENFSYPEHIDNESRIFTTVLYVTPKDNIGTILCKNESPLNPDHGRPSLKSEYEVESTWKQNRLFAHNSLDGKTWHRYGATTQRCTLNCFFVEPSKIIENRIENKFLIDIEKKYYEN